MCIKFKDFHTNLFESPCIFTKGWCFDSKSKPISDIWFNIIGIEFYNYHDNIFSFFLEYKIKGTEITDTLDAFVSCQPNRNPRITCTPSPDKLLKILKDYGSIINSKTLSSLLKSYIGGLLLKECSVLSNHVFNIGWSSSKDYPLYFMPLESDHSPVKHSVKELLSVGIQPDILVCRTEAPITEEVRHKIALFCNVEERCVIPNVTAHTLYEVPLLLEKEGLCDAVCRRLGLGERTPDMTEWTAMVEKIKGVHRRVEIALVGKYTGLRDAYLSVAEALFHAGTACDAEVEIRWVDSENLTPENIAETLAGCGGILVPGGFGDRGIEGMILAAQFAREKGIPYFGICLGMQIAVIEFARHVADWQDANSAEFSGSTAHPVIALMPEQVGVTQKGGTMRLGRYPCVLSEGTRALSLYGEKEISERHRHRYEFNNDFRCELQQDGLTLAGTSPDGALVEIVEIKDHPWYVGCQFHPEFKSRPNRPHPLFYGFVKAALEAEEKR